MVIIGVVLYFVAVTLALAWGLMPAFRERVRGNAGRARDAGASAARAARLGGRARTADARARLGRWRDPCTESTLLMRGRWRWLALAAAVLVGMPLTALVWRQWDTFDGFDHTASRVADPQVTALLQGEQLVPPAALPPELFTTRDLEAARPLIGTASRQWELLDGEFRQRLLVVFKLMKEQHGYDMVLLEGYRSPERQNQLATLGPTVTHVAGGASYHQYGLAADCAFLLRGRVVVSERDPDAARGYALYGAIAQSVGLTWGGSWRSLRDLGHAELRRPEVLSNPTTVAPRSKP